MPKKKRGSHPNTLEVHWPKANQNSPKETTKNWTPHFQWYWNLLVLELESLG